MHTKKQKVLLSARKDIFKAGHMQEARVVEVESKVISIRYRKTRDGRTYVGETLYVNIPKKVADRLGIERGDKVRMLLILNDD